MSRVLSRPPLMAAAHVPGLAIALVQDGHLFWRRAFEFRVDGVPHEHRGEKCRAFSDHIEQRSIDVHEDASENVIASLHNKIEMKVACSAPTRRRSGASARTGRRSVSRRNRSPGT